MGIEGLVKTGGPMEIEDWMSDTVKATNFTPGEPGIMRPQGGGLPPDRWNPASMSAPSALISKEPQRWVSSGTV